MRKIFTSTLAVLSIPSLALAASSNADTAGAVALLGGMLGLGIMAVSFILAVLWMTVPFILLSMNSKLKRLVQVLDPYQRKMMPFPPSSPAPAPQSEPPGAIQGQN